MASSKTVTVVRNNVTMTAGAGDSTSSSTDLTDGYGATALVKLTNGGTGPTVAAQVQIQVSGDDSNYYDYGGPLVGNTDNSGVESWAIDIPASVEYVQFVSGSNTGQDVTLRVEVNELSKI
jgi:hypothetical protein